MCADGCAGLVRRAALPVVVGSGSFNTVRYLDAFAELARSLHAVLRAGGIMAMRLVVAPAVPETALAVLRWGLAGAIAQFPEFEFRLAPAPQTKPGGGVAIDDIWQRWQSAAIDVETWAAVTGWKCAEIATIDRYRDSPG